MEPTFCLATASDADRLLGLMRDYYLFDGHTFDEAKARAALLALLQNQAFGRAWLICDDSVAVGYVVLTFGYSLEYLGRDAFLDEFYLRESYRGRGWGRRALQFVEDQARAETVRTIHLEVVRENAHAREFYRRQGFIEHRHFLMSKWIERAFPKPVAGSPKALTNG